MRIILGKHFGPQAETDHACQNPTVQRLLLLPFSLLKASYFRYEKQQLGNRILYYICESPGGLLYHYQIENVKYHVSVPRSRTLFPSFHVGSSKSLRFSTVLASFVLSSSAGLQRSETEAVSST